MIKEHDFTCAAIKNNSSLIDFTPAHITPREMPGNTYELLPWPGSNRFPLTVTGSNGEPLAKIAVPWNQAQEFDTNKSKMFLKIGESCGDRIQVQKYSHLYEYKLVRLYIPPSR